MKSTRSVLKRAELLSTVGAAVLGGGIALLLQRWLAAFAIPIIVVGLFAHAFGMFDKHRIESGAGVERARWEGMLYWFCWGILAVLAGVVAIAAVTWGSGLCG